MSRLTHRQRPLLSLHHTSDFTRLRMTPEGYETLGIILFGMATMLLVMAVIFIFHLRLSASILLVLTGATMTSSVICMAKGDRP
jgi:hypothetical protein